MRTLKYLSIFIVGLTLLFNTQSCKLKEELKDVPTQIKNEEDATTVINGLYAQLGDAGGFKHDGMLMLMLTADDIYSIQGAEFGNYAKRIFTSVDTQGMWDTLYFAIANANNLISVLDNSKFSPDFEKRAYGEAYFIRAFCYYYLVRLYGGVPLNTTITTVKSNFYLPKSTVDQVYAQIFSDFKAASARLPVYGTMAAAELGRASKGAAQAILSQAYLTYGNHLSLNSLSPTTQYQSAILYADSVTTTATASGYGLLANYGDLFDINKEAGAYNEVLFGLRFTADPQKTGAGSNGSEEAYYMGNGNTSFVCGNPVDGKGVGNLLLMPWIADYYRKGDYTTGGATPVIDYRNERAFYQTGFNNAQQRTYTAYPNIPPASANFAIQSALISKYIDPQGKDTRNNGNDLFIIRLAEVYLIKAEAENELNGPTTLALTAFNTVRQRARNANGTARTVPANLTTVTAGTKDNFRMKIFDERELELVGEGQRWFDLVRMRSPLSPTQTMYEYQFKVRLNVAANFPQTLPTYNTAQRKFTNANAIYAPALDVSVPKFLLFPIPTVEMNQNPNIGSQNPGW